MSLGSAHDKILHKVEHATTIDHVCPFCIYENTKIGIRICMDIFCVCPCPEQEAIAEKEEKKRQQSKLAAASNAAPDSSEILDAHTSLSFTPVYLFVFCVCHSH